MFGNFILLNIIKKKLSHVLVHDDLCAIQVVCEVFSGYQKLASVAVLGAASRSLSSGVAGINGEGSIGFK